MSLSDWLSNFADSKTGNAIASGLSGYVTGGTAGGIAGALSSVLAGKYSDDGLSEFQNTPTGVTQEKRGTLTSLANIVKSHPAISGAVLGYILDQNKKQKEAASQAQSQLAAQNANMMGGMNQKLTPLNFERKYTGLADIGSYYTYGQGPEKQFYSGNQLPTGYAEGGAVQSPGRQFLDPTVDYEHYGENPEQMFFSRDYGTPNMTQAPAGAGAGGDTGDGGLSSLTDAAKDAKKAYDTYQKYFGQKLEPYTPTTQPMTNPYGNPTYGAPDTIPSAGVEGPASTFASAAAPAAATGAATAYQAYLASQAAQAAGTGLGYIGVQSLPEVVVSAAAPTATSAAAGLGASYLGASEGLAPITSLASAPGYTGAATTGGLSSLGTAASYAAPIILGALAVDSTLTGRDADVAGAHSNSINAVGPGQQQIYIGNGQQALQQGNLILGAGNDRSQGTGQFFQAGSGGNQYLGANDSATLRNWTQMHYGPDNVVDVSDPEMYKQAVTAAQQAAGGVDAEGGGSYYQPTYAASLGLYDIYNRYGGQNGWGTSFMDWVKQIGDVNGNVSGNVWGS